MIATLDIHLSKCKNIFPENDKIFNMYLRKRERENLKIAKDTPNLCACNGEILGITQEGKVRDGRIVRRCHGCQAVSTTALSRPCSYSKPASPHDSGV